MNNLGEFVQHAEDLVKSQVEALQLEGVTLFDIEDEILNFVNEIGSLLESLVLSEIEEPTQDNRILINGKNALYKGMATVSFKDRFGNTQKLQRRSYKVEDQKGYIYPLDHKIGIDKCRRYSPLLSFLIGSHAANESYSSASKLLSTTLGFSISSTAIQNNAERIGANIPDDPINQIPGDKQSHSCDLMLVEMDGTMSPQIPEIEGITGRESLKVPTEYKECNVLVIEKYRDKRKVDRWVGADYGKRTYFEDYFRKSSIKMGLLSAKKVVFVADGAHHNWEMCKSHLPEAVEILDFYHATEHLSDFCDLIKDPKKGKMLFKVWRHQILEGDIFQVLDEMKQTLFHIEDTDSAQKEINYLNNNKFRMAYDEYRDEGYPIGSGLIEGQCKLVVNKRFKRNGMRWKIKDNRAILKLRLAFLNSTLSDYFLPEPLDIGFWEGNNETMSMGIAC
jgi:hypothetical protein